MSAPSCSTKVGLLLTGREIFLVVAANILFKVPSNSNSNFKPIKKLVGDHARFEDTITGDT